jgi:hypothetical protein
MDDESRAKRIKKALDHLPKTRVNWEDYKHIIEVSERYDAIEWPENHEWFLLKNVPMKVFKHISIKEIAAVEDPDERREHRERYRYILDLLKNGEEPWPVIVADNGLILDGFHRLAALNTLRKPTVDVLMPVD